MERQSRWAEVTSLRGRRLKRRILQSPNLAFDHCYTIDHDHKYLERLAKAGFTLDPSIIEHPGRHVCRFLQFASPQLKTRQYLEFVSQPVSQGNKPGLSFNCEGRLENLFNAMRSKHILKPTFEHRNYSWKTTGTKARELGWNFVHYRRKISAAKIWLTEYERSNEKKPRWKPPTHINGALGIIGLIFGTNASGRRYFENILQRRIDGTLRLPCGTQLILEPAATTRFRGVLIKAASFQKFCARAKPDEIRSRRGRLTAVLKNPVGSWDILVV